MIPMKLIGPINWFVESWNWVCTYLHCEFLLPKKYSTLQHVGVWSADDCVDVRVTMLWPVGASHQLVCSSNMQCEVHFISLHACCFSLCLFCQAACHLLWCGVEENWDKFSFHTRRVKHMRTWTIQISASKQPVKFDISLVCAHGAPS